MTKTQELLEAVRVAMDGATDYAIAKALKLHRPRVHDYRTGKRHADAYAATQMALALKRDPLEVIAEVEAESASSAEKREFWKSFGSGLRQALFGGALLLTGSSFGPGQTGAASEPGSHNGRLRQRPAQEKGPARGFFLLPRLGRGPGWFQQGLAFTSKFRALP